MDLILIKIELKTYKPYWYEEYHWFYTTNNLLVVAGKNSDQNEQLVKKYMNGKASSIMSFGIKGGLENGTKFIDKLKLIVRLVNIGDAKSLACHPASTTHRQLDEQGLKKAGVSSDMIRLSIGIEHIERDEHIHELQQKRQQHLQFQKVHS